MDEQVFSYISKEDSVKASAVKFSGNPYNEFLGIGDNKDKTQQIKAETMAKFSPLSPKADCEAVQIEADKVQFEMDALRGRITAGEKAKLFAPALAYLEEMKAKYKAQMSTMQCEKKQLEAESNAATQQTIDILGRVTPKSGDTQGGSQTTNYIIWGIGGLLVLAAGFILFKKD